MLITIINDCRDENAKGRQVARVGTLFNTTPNFIGVLDDTELAGNILDTLDAYGDAFAIVLANVAPRGKTSGRLGNGSHFGFFKFRNSYVLSTIGGYELSLAKKVGILNKIKLIDFKLTTSLFIEHNLSDLGEVGNLQKTQFRSFEFLPKAGFLLSKLSDLPGETIAAEDIKNAQNSIWLIDNFGNLKTTILPEEIGFTVGRSYSVFDKNLIAYERLKDVPEGKTGLIIGSSGLEGKHFLEIVVAGGSAGNFFQVKVGEILKISLLKN